MFSTKTFPAWYMLDACCVSSSLAPESLERRTMLHSSGMRSFTSPASSVHACTTSYTQHMAHSACRHTHRKCPALRINKNATTWELHVCTGVDRRTQHHGGTATRGRRHNGPEWALQAWQVLSRGTQHVPTDKNKLVLLAHPVAAHAADRDQFHQGIGRCVFPRASLFVVKHTELKLKRPTHIPEMG